jgi:hypothetical protein
MLSIYIIIVLLNQQHNQQVIAPKTFSGLGGHT